MYSAPALALKYIHYYFTSANGKGHGVHSPFVFDFIKNVLSNKSPIDGFAEIENARNHLLNDNRTIDVEDFGAGSSVIKTNKRVIGRMAASSLKPKKYAQLLYRIVQYFKPASILELGTSFGISSAYMAKANPAATLYTMEGAGAIANIAEENFQALHLQNIQLIRGDFQQTLEPLLQKLREVDLAFIDGNHRKEPTLQYFNGLLSKITDNSILIFDDIHWSSGMEEAWQEIKSNAAVTLSIDLFFIGILFFRKDFKVKQDFVIRF